MVSTKVDFFFGFAISGKYLFENKHHTILSLSLKYSFAIVPLTQVWRGIWQLGLIKMPNSAEVSSRCAPWNTHLE